jgi:hypothetical protein
MGAGASIPDSLDQEECKKLAGDQFDKKQFNKMEKDGHITKDQFIQGTNQLPQLHTIMYHRPHNSSSTTNNTLNL